MARQGEGMDRALEGKKRLDLLFPTRLRQQQKQERHMAQSGTHRTSRDT